MIDEAARDPGIGIGKPERLSHDLSGYWSRRITRNTAWSTPATTNSSSCRPATTTDVAAARRFW